MVYNTKGLLILLLIIAFSCSSKRDEAVTDNNVEFGRQQFEDSIRIVAENEAREKYTRLINMKEELNELEHQFISDDQNLNQMMASLEVERGKLDVAKRGKWWESDQEKERNIMGQALMVLNLQKRMLANKKHMQKNLTEIQKLRKNLDMPQFETGLMDDLKSVAP